MSSRPISFITSGMESSALNGSIENPETETQFQVFEGKLELADSQPSTRTVRVYVHSDCTDANLERQRLWRNVFPEICSYARNLGLHLHFVDMYHMITCPQEEQAKLPFLLEVQGIYELALKEISLCQDVSCGISFITFLGQKYGHRSLKKSIDAEEFELLFNNIEDPSHRECIRNHYRLDKKSVPSYYKLQLPQDISNEWVEKHDVISKSIRKGAKVAFGKDPLKVQNYTISVSEEEISQGVFSCPKGTERSCVWFKRIFTDLFDQRPSMDPSTALYCDVTTGRRGLEFDSETVKLMNYLKEARMPGKYTGLDLSNIFEFPIKWYKSKGLTPEENSDHEAYLVKLCEKVTEFMKQSLKDLSAKLEEDLSHAVYQECLLHAKHCNELLQGFKECPLVVDMVTAYLNNPSSHRTPLVLYGETGSGKSSVMATVIRLMAQREQEQCIIMRFVKLTPSASNIRRLLKSICEQISHVYKCKTRIPINYPDLLQTFNSLLSSLSCTDKPLYIFLDGIDQLDPDYEGLGLSWMPINLPDNVYFVVSVSSETAYRCYPLLRGLLNESDSFVNVPSLNFDEAESFLQYLLSQFKLKITPAHIFLLEDSLKKHTALTPLYLKIIAFISNTNALTMKKGIYDLKSAVFSYFDHLEDIHGKSYVSSVLSCITAANYGLSESELLDILSCDRRVLQDIQSKCRSLPMMPQPINQVPVVAWSRLLHDLYPHLLCFRLAEGGICVLQWKQRTLHEIAVERYLKTEEESISVCSVLASYFSGKMALELTDTMLDTGPVSNAENEPDSEIKLCSQSWTSNEILDPPADTSKDENLDSEANQLAQTQSSACSSDNESRQSLTMVPVLPRAIHKHGFTLSDNVYNIRRMTELPKALFQAKQFTSLVDILTDYQSIKAYAITGLVSEVIRYLSYLIDPVPLTSQPFSLSELRLLQESLLLSMDNLAEDPSQFAVELLGRLLPFGISNNTQSLIKDLLIHCIKHDSPYLCPVHFYTNPPGEPLLLSLSGHLGPITGIDSTIVPFKKPRSAEISEKIVILSSSQDGTLKSWDWKGSGILKTFNGHSGGVLSTALSRNGLYAASGGKDCDVRFWNMSSTECLHVMKGHKSPVTAVTVSKVGERTMSGSLDSTVKVWNTDQRSGCKGQLVFTIIPSQIIPSPARAPVHSLCLCKDDSELLAGLDNGSVVIMNVVSGEILRYFEVSLAVGKPILSLAVAQVNEKRVIISVSDHTAFIQHYDSGAPYDSVPCGITLHGKLATTDQKSILSRLPRSVLSSQDISTFTFANLGSLGLAGSREGGLTIWNLKHPHPHLDTSPVHKNAIACLTYSSCGGFIASASNSSSNGTLSIINIWQSDDLMKPISVIEGIKSPVLCLVFCKDKKFIFSGHEDGFIRIWNTQTQKMEKEFLSKRSSRDGFSTVEDSSVRSLALSSDNKVLIAGVKDGRVIVWNVKDLKNVKKIVTFYEHGHPIVSVLFTPALFSLRNQYFVGADNSGLILVRDYLTSANVSSTQPEDVNEAELCCLEVGQNHTRSVVLGIGYSDGKIAVCSIPNLEPISVLKSNYGSITSIGFLQGQECFISTTGSGCVQLWDKYHCVERVTSDIGITTGRVNPIGHLSVFSYGCKNGYIGTFWCNVDTHHKSENMILKMLNQTSPVGSGILKSQSSVIKGKASQSTLHSLKEDQETERNQEEEHKGGNGEFKNVPLSSETASSERDVEAENIPPNHEHNDSKNSTTLEVSLEDSKIKTSDKKPEGERPELQQSSTCVIL